MSAITLRYDISGFPSGGGDPVAFLSMSVPSFQAGEAVIGEFLDSVRAFFAAQQNVDTVVVSKVETVTTNI